MTTALDVLPDFIHEQVRPHLDHPWRKVGRCVYCGPCHKRLYQGDMPSMQTVYVPPYKPSEADKMRERWGKP